MFDRGLLFFQIMNEEGSGDEIQGSEVRRMVKAHNRKKKKSGGFQSMGNYFTFLIISNFLQQNLQTQKTSYLVPYYRVLTMRVVNAHYQICVNLSHMNWGSDIIKFLIWFDQIWFLSFQVSLFLSTKASFGRGIRYPLQFKERYCLTRILPKYWPKGLCNQCRKAGTSSDVNLNRIPFTTYKTTLHLIRMQTVLEGITGFIICRLFLCWWMGKTWLLWQGLVCRI